MSQGTTGSRLTGGCQCGAVRSALDSEPRGAGVCHCRMCQRAGGGPYMAFGGVKQSEIAWIGTPKTFASSTIAERGFCGECGTSLTFRFHGKDRIGVTLGSLDDPESVRPTDQHGVESRLSWTEGVRDLPAERTDDWLTGDLAASFRNHQHRG